MLLALLPAALAAPCPGPAGEALTFTPDGAAHVLARDAATTCWWIVDDAGDAYVAARWERPRPEPILLTAMAEGRLVLLVHDRAEARWRVTLWLPITPGRDDARR